MQIKRKSIESGVKSFKAPPLYSLSAAKKGWRGTKKLCNKYHISFMSPHVTGNVEKKG
jgi:hypothetical protein